MTLAMKLFFSVFTGLAAGVVVMFLTLGAVVAYAFAAATTAFIPGLITVWITTENELPAVNFAPNGAGALVVVGAVAAIVVAAAFARFRAANRTAAH